MSRMTVAEAERAHRNGDAPILASNAAPTLPEEFWERKRYAHIRQAAYSRSVSPAATFGAVLARIAGATSHHIKLPGIIGGPVGLSFFTVITGRTGTGKSSANAVAGELIRVQWDRVYDNIPLGSGEGLAEILFEIKPDPDDRTKKVKIQTRWNAILFMDEGQVLAELGRRNNSTLLPTVRTIWTGGTLGQTNASAERKRIVPQGQYAYGIVMALQPSLAGPLLEDADAGSPARFTWVASHDCGIPIMQPEWPGMVEWTAPQKESSQHIYVPDSIRTELVSAYHQRLKGAGTESPLDSHRGLMQLKIAGLLALLEDDEKFEIDEDDWHLASLFLKTSDDTRDWVISQLGDQASQREQLYVQKIGGRAVETQAALDRRKIVECSERIGRKVHERPEGWNRGDLRRQLFRHRDWFDEGLEAAIAEGWVTVINEASHTNSQTVRIVKGAKRP